MKKPGQFWSLLLIVSFTTLTSSAHAITASNFFSTIYSYFTDDLSNSLNTLHYIKTRALNIQQHIDQKQKSTKELTRKLNVELNLSYHLLQENRAHLSNEIYSTLKHKIDLSRYHVLMNQYYTFKKNIPSAQHHLSELNKDTSTTIQWIQQLESATGALK